jgi:perosamine synthetase
MVGSAPRGGKERPIRVHEPDLGDLEVEEILSCLRAGMISGHAPIVARFEAAFAARIGAAHAIAVSSGTAALHVALAALRLAPGDEVVVPSFTFAPCADTIVHAGGRPVFVDSDPRTLCIDVGGVEAALARSDRIRAVLGVHIYGQPCDVVSLRRLCDERGIAFVEDAAQGLGSEVGGRAAGLFGHLACFSFYANKGITTGEGGAITTGDGELAERARRLRNHALVRGGPPYLHDECAFNYRMPALCAALGIAQLRRFDDFLAKRDAREALYRSELDGVRGLRWLPAAASGERHSHWCHIVMLNDAVSADAAAHALAEAGIETRRFYHPLHLHPPYGYTGPALPQCEGFAPRGLVLPSGNATSLDDVRRVCGALRELLG